MLLVTKADGRKEPFYKEKIVKTCLKMHVSQEQAKEIAEKIERKAYDGMETREILKMIFEYVKKYRPEVRYRTDLREAIALLRPKPDFEQFVLLLLKEYGYEVFPPQLIKGRCVEHEVDAVAKKNDETILVEVKHHLQHHTYTGVDACLEAQASYEDLKEGSALGLNSINFNKLLIVCNTKFSEHAKQYARCKGIFLIGWKTPPEQGLEQMIEEKRLYPITLLRSVDKKTKEKLADSGILLLKQLIERSQEDLKRKTRISRQKLKAIIGEAEKIIRG